MSALPAQGKGESPLLNYDEENEYSVDLEVDSRKCRCI